MTTSSSGTGSLRLRRDRAAPVTGVPLRGVAAGRCRLAAAARASLARCRRRRRRDGTRRRRRPRVAPVQCAVDAARRGRRGVRRHRGHGRYGGRAGPASPARARELLATTGSLERVPTDRLRVVPKVRTPVGGISFRSLSRYACVRDAGVDVRWHRAPVRRTAGPAVGHGNTLLLPWPLRVRERDFRPVPGSVQRTEDEPDGLFTFWPAEQFDAVERALVSALDEVDGVEVVVLPESAPSPCSTMRSITATAVPRSAMGTMSGPRKVAGVAWARGGPMNSPFSPRVPASVASPPRSSGRGGSPTRTPAVRAPARWGRPGGGPGRSGRSPRRRGRRRPRAAPGTRSGAGPVRRRAAGRAGRRPGSRPRPR